MKRKMALVLQMTSSKAYEIIAVEGKLDNLMSSNQNDFVYEISLVIFVSTIGVPSVEWNKENYGTIIHLTNAIYSK